MKNKSSFSTHLSIRALILLSIILVLPYIKVSAAVPTETVVIQPGPEQGKDTYYGTALKTNGAPYSEAIEIGGWGDWYWSFLEMDLSSLPSDGSKIVSAHLELYQYGSGIVNNGKLERITQPWTEESVTKVSSPSSASVGMEWQTLPMNDWWSVDVTELTKAWVDGTYPNYGVKIYGQYNSGGSYPQKRFYSSDYLVDTTLRPKLVVEILNIEPQNKYPLYTQIESPYPSLLETAQWADDEYASGRGLLGEYPCGATIGECGCAITSLVMAARNAGIEEDVLGDDVNPGNMNAYLENVSGYDSVGSLYWLAAQVYFGAFREDGRVESRFATPVKRPAGESVMSFVNNALTDEKNAVLAYKNGHFVWVPEKTSDGYLVNDPWWYNTKTADDVAGDKVRDYNNTFDDARVFSIADEPVILSSGAFEAHVRGTAELLFTKGTGEQVGYVDGGVVIDLEHASYDGTEVVSVNGASQTDGKSLLVYDSGSEFTIEVAGTEFGEFTAEFFAVSPSGEIQTFELSGETIPGVVTTFIINAETGEVTEEPLSYEQFLALLNTVLADYPKQQRAFFLQWARMMFDSMQDKSVTQALKKIEVYKKLLKAKKINTPILGGALDLLTEGLSRK